MRVGPASLRVRLGQGDAFGLEDGFRFALRAFGVIARPPSPALAPVMARLVPEGQFQVGTALGKIAPGFIRAPEFGAEQGAVKRPYCLPRQAGGGKDATNPARRFTKKIVQERRRDRA